LLCCWRAGSAVPERRSGAGCPPALLSQWKHQALLLGASSAARAEAPPLSVFGRQPCSAFLKPQTNQPSIRRRAFQRDIGAAGAGARQGRIQPRHRRAAGGGHPPALLPSCRRPAAAQQPVRPAGMGRFATADASPLPSWCGPLQGRDHRWEAGAVQALARLREQQLDLQASSRRWGRASGVVCRLNVQTTEGCSGVQQPCPSRHGLWCCLRFPRPPQAVT
jgi:hypothetical protein